MRVNEAKVIIKSFIEKNIKIPVILLGPPGIGKTAICQQIADELDYECLIFECSSLDPSDVRGLPFFENGTTKFSLSPLHPKVYTQGDNKPGIIVLDEISFAAKTVQRALNSLLLQRRLGIHRIPENYFIVATGNPPEYGGDILINTLINRCCILDVQPDMEDWLENCPGINPLVRSFIRLKNKYFYTYNVKEQNQSFCSPRTWMFVSELVDKDIINKEAFVGLVGPAGIDFYNYVTIKKLKEIDIDKILQELIIEEDINVLMYINEAIVQRILNNDIHPNLVNYILKLSKVSKELAYILLKFLAKKPLEIFKSGKITEIKKVFGDSILLDHIVSRDN